MHAARYARRVAAALMSCALAAGCSEAPLSPKNVAGTYALRQIAGILLPADGFTSESYVIRVYADTLRLSTDLRGRLTRVAEVRPRNGAPSAPALLDTPFSFRAVDDRLEIEFACPINATCVEGPHLILRQKGTGLQAVYPRSWSGGWTSPLLYSRVGP